MTGKPSPSPGDATGRRGEFEGLEVCGEVAWDFQIQATRESCARRTRDLLGRGKFQPSFFLPLFGPGKIPGEAFFCHGFGERGRRGGCWGCAMSAPLVWGL